MNADATSHARFVSRWGALLDGFVERES